ncbi:PilZ domain-containing protein [Myxococcota bacterium]|nr:PilZ domain-containing protein [Myxococcota bacterium]
MPTSHFVLLIEPDPHRTETLAAQLVRMGVEPIRVGELSEATKLVASRSYAISGVLIPTLLAPPRIAQALETMRQSESVLPAMAYGKMPDPASRKILRQAGVVLALWDGYDEGILRFQINRLTSGEQISAARTSRRVPTHVPARILVGGREKRGILYSLSEGGCFIETPRASMDGARLRTLFEIDGERFEIDGIVAFANVPGNLQRPNLPLGMGIQFDHPDAVTCNAIARVIQERLANLEV